MALKLTFIFFLFTISSIGYAEQAAGLPPSKTPSTARTGIEQTELVDVKKEQAIQEQAKLFGLTQAEWVRYEALMKGPQRFQNPNVDPVFALGAHAKNESERKKYAELAVRNMHQYMDGVLAFQRAYQDAQARLFGHLPLLRDEKAKRTEPLKPLAGGLRMGDKILFFTRALQCEVCQVMLQKLITLVKQQEGKRIGADIYFMDSGRVDAVAQKYAIENGIPLKWVQNQLITLNHENGELFRLDATRTAPTVIIRRGNDYYDFQLP